MMDFRKGPKILTAPFSAISLLTAAAAAYFRAQ